MKSNKVETEELTVPREFMNDDWCAKSGMHSSSIRAKCVRGNWTIKYICRNLPSWIINIYITHIPRNSLTLISRILRNLKAKKEKQTCLQLSLEIKFCIYYHIIYIIYILFQYVNPFTLRIFYEFGYALKTNYSLMRSVSFLWRYRVSESKKSENGFQQS